jgi:hypothetical protein
MKTYGERLCHVCRKKFTATGPTQQRCQPCVKADAHAGAPKCKCGCGEDVRWSRVRRGWREYLHGHHIRVTGSPAKGKTWSFGPHVSYKHKCKACGKRFANKFKVAKFCSQACAHGHFSGKNHPMYTTGVRTKYRAIRAAGKMVRAHRVVMSAVLGRKLLKTEVVHHLDGDGHNNNPDNLRVMHCTGCHSHMHTTGVACEYVYPSVHKSK